MEFLAIKISEIQSNFPQELLGLPNWVNWKPIKDGARVRKPPFNARTNVLASSNDPNTWSGFEDAKSNTDQDDAHVGIMLDGTFSVLDLDHCLGTNGNLCPVAADIVAMADTYCEESPSGTGLHLFFSGQLPTPNNQGFKGKQIEAYSKERFITVTGRVYGEKKPMRDGAEVLRQILEKYDGSHFDRRCATASLSPTFFPQNAASYSSEALQQMTESLFRTIERSKDKEEMMRFMRTPCVYFNTRHKDGSHDYYSPSEARGRFLCKLAFWTRKDPVWMDYVFRQSQLYRDDCASKGKWDSRRGNMTLGQLEIGKALGMVTNVYNGTYYN